MYFLQYEELILRDTNTLMIFLKVNRSRNIAGWDSLNDSYEFVVQSGDAPTVASVGRDLTSFIVVGFVKFDETIAGISLRGHPLPSM